MLKKTKLSKDDYQYLLERRENEAWNGAGRIAADIKSAGHDNITATWFGFIWEMLGLCQHHLDPDGPEMERYLRKIWDGLRTPKNDGTDLPFPKLILAEDFNGFRDVLELTRHIISEREYFLNTIYEVEDD
jgi:hypothetical protein